MTCIPPCSCDCRTQEIGELRAELTSVQEQLGNYRSAVSFWRMARYPEKRPSPDDIVGRSIAQATLDVAETTLYNLPTSSDQEMNGAWMQTTG